MNKVSYREGTVISMDRHGDGAEKNKDTDNVSQLDLHIWLCSLKNAVHLNKDFAPDDTH